MENTITVEQLGSSITSFLLIPSVFVLAVYIGKFFDGRSATPAVCSIEAIIGIVLSTALILISLCAQNKSSFSVAFLPAYYEGISSSIWLQNLSDKDAKIKFKLYADGVKAEHETTIKKYSQYKISQTAMMDILQIKEASRVSVIIEANLNPDDVLIDAGISSEMGREKVNAQRNGQK